MNTVEVRDVDNFRDVLDVYMEASQANDLPAALREAIRVAYCDGARFGLELGRGLVRQLDQAGGPAVAETMLSAMIDDAVEALRSEEPEAAVPVVLQ